MPSRPLPPGVPADEASRLANRLNSAAIHLLRRIGRDDAADGLTGARASALSVLVFGGASSLGELARREGVATPTMSRIVDALARDGLLAREPSREDRRVTRLRATPRGRRLMERGRSRRILRLAAEIRGLTASDRAALERAVGILEGLEEPLGRKETT